MNWKIAAAAVLFLSRTLVSAGDGEERLWLRQDFEDRKVFSAEAIGKTAGVEIPAAPFAKIVTDPSPEHGQVLELLRGRKLTFTWFRGDEPIPANCDFTVGFDCFIGDKGRLAISLLNEADQRIGGIMLRAASNISFLGAAGAWGPVKRLTPREWFRVELDFKVGDGVYVPRLILADGRIEELPVQPILDGGRFAAVRMNTMPPADSVERIDNVEVKYAEKSSTSGRRDAAAGAMVSGQRGWAGDFTPASGAELAGTEAGVELAMKSDEPVSTLLIRADAGMDFDVYAYNPGGHRLVLAENMPFPEREEELQLDFKPTEIGRLMLNVRGRAGSRVEKVAVLEARIVNLNQENADFVSRIYGEFRLPVYEKSPSAGLHLINATDKTHRVAIRLYERFSGRSVVEEFEKELPPGETRVDFPLAELAAGDYVAEVADAEKNADERGSFRRLLRRQLPVVPVAPEFFAVTGEKLYFPDGYYLRESSGIDFEPAVARQIRVTPEQLVPGMKNHIGGELYMADGKVNIRFSVMDYFYNLKTRRLFVASSAPDDLTEWSFREWDDSMTKPVSKCIFAAEKAVADNRPKPGAGGRIDYRFYDPERDGTVRVDQVEIKYITFIPAGEYGGEPEAIWEGGFRPQTRTTWPIWHKSPGESLVLTREPFLTDDRSAGEFEDPRDTNDNFVGQWLSDDGKTLFYGRGHCVRRNPPFNVPYDNLAPGSRMITVFSTRDGINFERRFAALPTENDPPGTQHYGGFVRRLKDGGGLRIGFFIKYIALEQRYCYELAYSWDGFNWEHFPDCPPFLDNGDVGSWNCGLLVLSGQSVQLGKRQLMLISRARNIYHFCGVVLASYTDHEKLTGKIVEDYLVPRGIRNWPFLNRFRDFDELAALMRNARSDVGVAELRTDGFFALTAGGDREGSFTTRPLTATSGMSANLEVQPQGYFRIRLLDENGVEIPGTLRELGECDSLEEKLYDSLPEGKFCIRGELRNAKLYTLNFK